MSNRYVGMNVQKSQFGVRISLVGTFDGHHMNTKVSNVDSHWRRTLISVGKRHYYFLEILYDDALCALRLRPGQTSHNDIPIQPFLKARLPLSHLLDISGA